MYLITVVYFVQMVQTYRLLRGPLLLPPDSLFREHVSLNKLKIIFLYEQLIFVKAENQ